jgi:hypothetical protein
VAWAARIVAVAVAFVLGFGVGKTVEEAEVDERVRTSVRTLKPLPLAPARETVTITTNTSR